VVTAPEEIDVTAEIIRTDRMVRSLAGC
jgi:hypothetical protein